MEVQNSSKAGEAQQQGLVALVVSLVLYVTTLFSRLVETATNLKENISNPEVRRLFISLIPCITVIEAIEDDVPHEEGSKKEE